MKKAQWGPDAVIGISIFLVIGIGGIFMISFFVEGLSLENLMRIMDDEIDKKCFFLMTSMVRDEYIRAGDADLLEKEGNDVFLKSFEFYGGRREGISKQSRFYDRAEVLNNSFQIMPFYDPGFVYGYIGPNEYVDDFLLGSGYDADKITMSCFYVPIYDPALRTAYGTSILLISEPSQPN